VARPYFRFAAIALLACCLLGCPGAIERELRRVSFGPTVSAAAALNRNGFGGTFAVGGTFTLFDVDATTDPACEERRRKEREALGGGQVKPWGDVVGAVQQPCRPLSEYWWPILELGIEAGLGLESADGAQVRLWGGGPHWKWFMLGVSLSFPAYEDTLGELRSGLRVGAELSAHFRLGGEKFRPVLVIFLRGELTALRRNTFPDQGLLGARFLYDL
jgi:hypothetical protein